LSIAVSASDDRAIALALNALRAGDLVVIPTDTVYGLAARVDDSVAVERVFEVKRRAEGMALPVLVDSLIQAEQLGVLDESARSLAKHFWPGVLTIVVKRVPGFDARLGGDESTVGLRVPDLSFCLALLEEVGPLATTSANISGAEAPPSIGEIEHDLGDSVAVFVDGGHLKGRASTVVSLVGEPQLLREGSIAWSEIRQVLWS
jgi:L-threonylcarbamoyladenylate synthase